MNEHKVYILHSGEPSQRELAERLAHELGGLDPPELVTARELVDRYRAGKGRNRLVAEAERVLSGAMIVLLSRAMVGDEETRAALVAAATGGTAVLTLRRYFIGCGVTLEELRASDPDLAPIYENFTLHAEDQLAAILEDIRHTPRQSGARSDGLVLAGGTLAGWIGASLVRLYPLRFLLAAALGLVLFMGWSEAWAVALAIGCFFMVGLGLSRTDPIDLWPWLGRCWKFSASATRDLGRPAALLPLGPLAWTGAVAAAALMMNGDRTAAKICLLSGVVLQAIVDDVFIVIALWQRRQPILELPLQTNACDVEQVRSARRSLLIVRHFNATYGFGSLLVIAFPAAIAATRYASHLHLCIAALAVGAAVPAVTSMVWLAASRVAMRFRGMTTEHIAVTGETFRGATRGAVPYPLGIDESLLSSFSQEERAQLEQFVFLQRLAYGGSLLRRWTAARDFAFISYAWNDPAAGDTAQRLDEALGAIGVEAFRDKRAIRDPYAAWRESVAVALMRCTHFFLVLSPGIRHAHVVQREIETMIQRRYLELMPAVICVGASEVERSLREDGEVPLPIRFLLTSCPQATLAEATDPLQLRYLVELTRRQGRWKDWMAILSAAAAPHLILRGRPSRAPRSVRR